MERSLDYCEKRLLNKDRAALILSNLLLQNKLRYNNHWECWTGLIVGTQEEWGEIPYDQLVNIASLIVSGMQQRPCDIPYTKSLLQKIECWTVKSDGLFRRRQASHQQYWYPACFDLAREASGQIVL